MPNTLISIRRSWPVVQKRAILDAVHQALVEALKIPADDRCLRIQQLAADDFSVMSQQSKNFTLLEIDMFAGRTLAAKKALYQAIVRNLGKLDIAPVDIKIVLREIPAENWGLRGGQAGSEVQLGFKIEV